MQTILPAIAKLKSCVKQVEKFNPSGASSDDILTRAKKLLADDPGFKRGFKFENYIEDNREFVEGLKQGSADRQKLYELQMIRAQNESRKLALQELREDNRIMAMDLSAMTDPSQLQYYQNERTRIWQKKNTQACHESTTSASTATADDYLRKFGSFLDDFSDN